MPWHDSEGNITEPAPIDLIARFTTCANYPRNDDYAVQLLTIALATAAREFEVGPAALVQRCVEESQFCPTEHDFITLARQMKMERIKREEEYKQQRQKREWEREYGPPQKINVGQLAASSSRRDDELWRALRQRYPASNWPKWSVLAADARELGFSDYADAWENR